MRWADFYGLELSVFLITLPSRPADLYWLGVFIFVLIPFPSSSGRLYGGIVPPRAASKRGDASGRRQGRPPETPCPAQGLPPRALWPQPRWRCVDLIRMYACYMSPLPSRCYRFFRAGVALNFPSFCPRTPPPVFATSFSCGSCSNFPLFYPLGPPVFTLYFSEQGFL